MSEGHLECLPYGGSPEAPYACSGLTSATEINNNTAQGCEFSMPCVFNMGEAIGWGICSGAREPLQAEH